MLVLGIESSCDETAAALADEDGRVRADVVHSQTSLHARYGGVVPELASRDHFRNIGPVVREAVGRSGATMRDIDAVAVTNRPGLIGALLVGVQVAKGMAWASGKPLVGVDHLVGHLFSVFLQRGSGPHFVPAFPYVCLLASGGHTGIYRIDGHRQDLVSELGGTRDDAAGEAFDKVARLLGLPYPGGPAIDRRSAHGVASAIRLRAPMPSAKTAEMSFSGIKTQVAQLLGTPGVAELAVDDVCASFQTTVTSVMAAKVVGTAIREKVGDVVLAGGVAANSELRRRTRELALEHGIRVHAPATSDCTDNAAMIAYAGALRLKDGARDGWDLVADSRTTLTPRTRKGRGRR